MKKWFEKNRETRTFRSKRKARTLDEAFEKSLKKWELIAHEDLDPDNDITTCGFCDLYNNRGKDRDDCTRCPVYKTTGIQYCVSTPFHDWDRGAERAEGAERAAEAELWFLRGLGRRIE